MAARKRSKRPDRPRLRVGDRVSFKFGIRWVKGTIIEDRGEIGYQGARLLRVRVPRSDSDDLIIELRPDELRKAS